MNETITDEKLLSRLSRIEGQIRGVSKMLEDGRYCIDVVNQVTAARKALEKVALLIIQRHINSCVKNAMAEGRGEELTEELVHTLDKFMR